jgi:hypothetical protein
LENLDLPSFGAMMKVLVSIYNRNTPKIRIQESKNSTTTEIAGISELYETKKANRFGIRLAEKTFKKIRTPEVSQDRTFRSG